VRQRRGFDSLGRNANSWPLTVMALLVFLSVVISAPAWSNPYFAKSGEAPATLDIASCAVTGGFTYLCVALDYDLFSKYGPILLSRECPRMKFNFSIARAKPRCRSQQTAAMLC